MLTSIVGYPWVLWDYVTGFGSLHRFLRCHSMLPAAEPLPQCPTRYAISKYVCSGTDFWSLLGSVGLVSRFGQFYKSVDPGLVQVNVCTESLRVVDVKIQISPIGRQKVITRDNVDVEM